MLNIQTERSRKFFQDQRKFRERIARVRSRLTDRYDPSLPKLSLQKYDPSLKKYDPSLKKSGKV